jgi:chromosome segregation protein
MEKELAFT